MAIDPPNDAPNGFASYGESIEAMLARFGVALEHASRHRQLVRDGLDYLNPDANNGANEPAETTGETTCNQ